MEQSQTKIIPKEKGIGDFLGIIRCLALITDANAFKKWIATYHTIESADPLISGYKLLFETLFRMLISNIEENISLDLSSDEIFNRASFRGISIYRLSNTCEKTIIIKNIAEKAKGIFNSFSWEQLITAMNLFYEQVIAELVKISEISNVNNAFRAPDIHTAIKYCSIFQVYIFLNDTSRGIPHGYTVAMLEDFDGTYLKRRQTVKNIDDNFFGYVYGVQYIWSKLLENEFNESIVKNIHFSRDWDSFDKYFEKIREAIILPIEKSSGVSLAFDNMILLKGNAKIFFENLLSDITWEEPLGEKETLLQKFLWYPIQLLDGSENEFSGIPTLIPLLMGNIQLRRRRGTEKSTAKVIRIIHGKESDHRRDYSYAVLVELGGYISDASGWMLFYDCCSDAGSTSGLYRDIEILLDRYRKYGFIEISSVRIEKRKFVFFIKDELTSLDTSFEG